MLARKNAFDMVGIVEAIAVGRDELAVDLYVKILGGIRLDGDGPGVYKNSPIKSVAVSHEEEHDDGGGDEEGESEQPKKHAPTDRTHKKENYGQVFL